MSEFLLILIAIVVLFSVFRRYIFYAVMGALAKKVFEQAARRQQYSTPRNQPSSGSINVEDQNRRKGGGNNTGDYVDFEEVKD